MTIAMWVSGLKPIPDEVGLEAVERFYGERDPKQVGFLPALDEFIVFADRIWQRQLEAKAQADQDAIADAAQLVFHQERTEDEPESIATFATDLIRDVMDGKVKHNSEEWKARRAEMDRRWPESPKRCPCEDGLIHYTVHKHNLPYEMVGRCSCVLGDRSPYKHLYQYDPYSGARVA